MSRLYKNVYDTEPFSFQDNLYVTSVEQATCLFGEQGTLRSTAF